MNEPLESPTQREQQCVGPSGPAPGHTPEMADLLVAYLEQIGVEYVFGIPGKAIEPLFDAMARSERRGGLRVVVARHETGAAFMAEGYARETGRLGVCCSTSGPGATNLITGVACAHANNIPLLAISGLPAQPSFGRGAFQESSSSGVNAVAMFQHCTHFNAMVSHPSQLERKLVNALMTARHASGAAYLAIPLDILRHPAPSTVPAYDMATLFKQKPVLIDESAVQTLKMEIQRAPRLVFLIGSGCFDAIEAIMALAELTRAMFITTPDAKGLVNPRHPAYCGVFGFGGHPSANALVSSAPDLVLAFGTDFNELISGGWCDTVLNRHLVHIDNSESNLLRSPMAQLHVRGQIRAVCEHLVELLQADSPSDIERVRDLLHDVYKAGVTFHAPESYHSDAIPLKPQRLMKTLSERCPPTTRFLTDMGNGIIWAVHYLQPHNRRMRSSPLRQDSGMRSGNANWLRVVMNFCPMGWSLGTAVGIAMGNRNCPVVCIVGDGSYLMSGQEITVAAAEQLTILFIVLNDSALGMVKHGQRLAKAEPVGYQLPEVDYRSLAEALGIPAHVIRTPQELDAIDFDAILRHKGPTLLDVRIDGEEIPPISARTKTLATSK